MLTVGGPRWQQESIRHAQPPPPHPQQRPSSAGGSGAMFPGATASFLRSHRPETAGPPAFQSKLAALMPSGGGAPRPASASRPGSELAAERAGTAVRRPASAAPWQR